MSDILSQDLGAVLRAAEQGDAEAQRRIGIHLQESAESWRHSYSGEAMEWLIKAAKQGDAEAQFRLGLVFYDGYYGEELVLT